MRRTVIQMVTGFLMLMAAHAAPIHYPDLRQSEQDLEAARYELKLLESTPKNIVQLAISGEWGRLRELDRYQLEFLTKLDLHIQKTIDFAIHRSLSLSECACGLLEAECRRSEGWLVDRATCAALSNSLRQLNELQQVYEDLKPLYGTPQDYKRVFAIHNYFKAQRTFASLLTKVKYDKSLGGGGESPRKKPFVEKLKWIAKSLNKICRFIPSAFRFLAELVLNREGNIDKNGVQNNPLIQALYSGINNISESDGIQYEIEGREYLQVPSSIIKDNKSITIFAPTHRGKPFDHYIMSQLSIPDATLFAATSQFPWLPGMGWIRKLLDHSNAFVTVGNGRGKPLQKLLELLRLGKTKSIYIYPEGMTQSGILELLPPRARFVSELIRGLQSNGYRVRIVPITNINAALFLRDYPRKGYELQRVKVHEPIEDEEIRALIEATGDDQIINRVLRAQWLDAMDHDAQHLMGMLKVDELKRSLSSQFLWEDCQAALRY